jgi:hypothetical protein
LGVGQVGVFVAVEVAVEPVGFGGEEASARAAVVGDVAQR